MFSEHHIKKMKIETTGQERLIFLYYSLYCEPPPRQPSGRQLAQSAGGPGFNPQSRTASSSIAQWQRAGIECGRSRVESQVKDRLLDSLVVESWDRVREVPGSIPSQGPPPRQPSGRELTQSTGGPGFNPQSRTASYQRRYKNGTSSVLV